MTTLRRSFVAFSSDGGGDAALIAFTRKDGTIRHFCGGEMNGARPIPLRMHAA
jgi:hypothetical protein